jgi:acetyltransferase-like isoleucine patch superfamily enzyme
MITTVKKFLKCWLNGRKVSHIGRGTEILGLVQRRADKSIISVGNRSLILGNLVAEVASSEIQIGNNVFIGGGTTIDCVDSIMIHDDVLVSHECIIADSDNHSVSYSIRKKDLADWRSGGGHDWSTTVTQPIVINKGAWLGARVMVLKGVNIGEGAVVGAGSVVTSDVAPYTIVAGNPARLIREIPLDER